MDVASLWLETSASALLLQGLLPFSLAIVELLQNISSPNGVTFQCRSSLMIDEREKFLQSSNQLRNGQKDYKSLGEL